MGTDAIIASTKTKRAIYIDRKHNADPTGDCDYDEFESGVTPVRAIELLNQAKSSKPSDNKNYWIDPAIEFISTLPQDDTVELIDEHRPDDAYWNFDNRLTIINK